MLNNRRAEILKLIVEEYKNDPKNPKPISSSSISKKLNVSPATVRNEMVALEKEGFIEKTHISSGRVPCEKGYRYYVDNLMEPKQMNKDDITKLQKIFENQSLGISDVIAKSLEIVSEITNYTAIMLGDNVADNKLKQVEVVPINEENVIAIVITDKGHVENQNINIKGSNLDEVKKIVELINKLVVGTPIGKVSERLEYDIKPIIANYVMHHEMLYNAFYNAFNNFKENNDFKAKGKENILDLPEFNSVEKVKRIVSELDDENLISAIKASKDEKDINIYIGKESNIDEDLTIIKTKYKVNDSEGTLAILGPKRMEYDRVVSLLDYIKKNIER